MDPNACLAELDMLRSGDDDEELELHASNLQSWLYHGGFEPNWDEYEHGTGLFRAWQAANAIVPFNAHEED